VAAAEGGGISVWEAVHQTPEVLLQREACNLVESLFADLVRKSAVLDRLRQGPNLRAALRERALHQAERYRQHPVTLDATSWAVARSKDRKAEQYRRALLEAETACQLTPDNGSYLTTLGAVQYRLGRYAAALETLRRSSMLNAARAEECPPYDLAFLAMTQHRLGSSEQAAACWEHLRAMVKQPRWSSDALSQSLLNEASELLGQKRP
jgi:tetratricopeptide (TPR) repeat protein